MSTEIRQLLEGVQSGALTVDEALLALKKAPFEDVGYAKVDLHRQLRQGAAEVIYGAGISAGSGVSSRGSSEGRRKAHLTISAQPSA